MSLPPNQPKPRLIGIDEVGRGCWAGPLVAGAVLLHTPIEGLRDSKKLSKARREQLAVRIAEQPHGLGWVTSQEIDGLGLTAAVRLAMQRALADIHAEYDAIVIDGSYNFLADNLRASTLVRADDTVPAVSAASIIAKVARDRYMTELGERYPAYGFATHVGYGTAAHQIALRTQGIMPEHRLSFKPISAILHA